jgi:hypothetical protein
MATRGTPLLGIAGAVRNSSVHDLELRVAEGALSRWHGGTGGSGLTKRKQALDPCSAEHDVQCSAEFSVRSSAMSRVKMALHVHQTVT